MIDNERLYLQPFQFIVMTVLAFAVLYCYALKRTLLYSTPFSSTLLHSTDILISSSLSSRLVLISFSPFSSSSSALLCYSLLMQMSSPLLSTRPLLSPLPLPLPLPHAPNYRLVPSSLVSLMRRN